MPSFIHHEEHLTLQLIFYCPGGEQLCVAFLGGYIEEYFSSVHQLNQIWEFEDSYIIGRAGKNNLLVQPNSTIMKLNTLLRTAGEEIYHHCCSSCISNLNTWPHEDSTVLPSQMSQLMIWEDDPYKLTTNGAKLTPKYTTREVQGHLPVGSY